MKRSAILTCWPLHMHKLIVRLRDLSVFNYMYERYGGMGWVGIYCDGSNYMNKRRLILRTF